MPSSNFKLSFRRKSKSLNVASPSSPPPPPPTTFEGDNPPQHQSGKPISALEVRELRDLILLRYSLDVKIWSDRGVGDFEYPEVEMQMRQADAALKKIREVLEIWHDKKVPWNNPDDKNKLDNILEKINLPGKQHWEGHPPWEDSERDVVYGGESTHW
jgi:hypothetical protein